MATYESYCKSEAPAESNAQVEMMMKMTNINFRLGNLSKLTILHSCLHLATAKFVSTDPARERDQVYDDV